MARINVRFGEAFESLRILRQAVDHLRRGNGQLQVPIPSDAEGAALAWVEAPQGELVVWVEIRRGLVHRVHLASPSLRNWALFDHAFGSDVLTDFAFIEHSFGFDPRGSGSLMLEWLVRGLSQGRITTRYPRAAADPPVGYRGRIDILDAGGSDKLTQLCPPAPSPSMRAGQCPSTGPLHPCGECVLAAPDASLPRRLRDGGSNAGGARRAGGVTEARRRETLGQAAAAFRRSIHIRHIDCGSDGAEEWRSRRSGPRLRHPAPRFFLTNAPRHADVLLVTGGVTTAMRDPLQRT